MRKSSFFTLFLCLVVFSACKSSYEKVRTSGDPQLLLTTADRYFEQKEYFRAQGLYELILTAFRGQKEAEEIYFKFAQTHYYLKEYELASYLFKNFSSTFINSPKKEEADYLSVYSLYKTSPGYRLDQSSTIKAIEGFQLFVNTYPYSDRVEECNKLIDECRHKLEEKAFESGKLYYDMENYQACVKSMQNLLIDFPETPNAKEVRLIICQASYELAVNSIYEKQKERLTESQAYCDQFIKLYPSGKQTNEVKSILKKINQKLKTTPYDRYQNTSARN